MSARSEGQPELKGWLNIGKVGRPHGLRGAFFLKTPENRTSWNNYTSILVKRRSGETFEAKVMRSYQAGGMLALQIEGLDSRDRVEPLYDAEIYVQRLEVELDDEEWLVGDLIGLKVVSSEQGELGRVISVSDFGAQHNLEILLSGSGKSVFFPLLDEFVEDIDVAAGAICIKYVPEFFEE